MTEPMQRIDSHTHLDQVLDLPDGHSFLQVLKDNNITAICHAEAYKEPETTEDLTSNNPGIPEDIISNEPEIVDNLIPKGPRTADDLMVYFFEMRERCEEARRAGVTVYRTAGIHPQKIPSTWETINDVDLYAMRAIFEAEFSCDDVVALGEVGLEVRGNEIQRYLLGLQLEYARDNRLPVAIHTPRQNKHIVSDELFTLIEGFGQLPICIEHAGDITILGAALDKGYYAGITVCDNKASVDTALLLIKKYQEHADRIMINSDVVKVNLPEYQKYLDVADRVAKEISPEVAKQVCHDTAKEFYRLG